MAEAVDPPFDRPDAGFNNLQGWTWVGCYGGYYLQADLLSAFEHGFFTRQFIRAAIASISAPPLGISSNEPACRRRRSASARSAPWPSPCCFIPGAAIR